MSARTTWTWSARVLGWWRAPRLGGLVRSGQGCAGEGGVELNGWSCCRRPPIWVSGSIEAGPVRGRRCGRVVSGERLWCSGCPGAPTSTLRRCLCA
eukprot:5330868-Alexandrium_andersonii.AAC.1